MFQKDYEIRYSDLDFQQKISIPTVIDLFQDISLCHSSATGYGLDELKSNGVAWLLQGWRIKIRKLPTYPGTLDVRTCVTDIRTVYGYRSYEIRQNGELMIVGKATWFMFDFQKKRPCKVKDGIVDGYGDVEEKAFGFDMVKLRPGDSFEAKMKFPVLKKELDTNDHLNNMKSVQMLMEVLPDGFSFDEMQITYRKTAEKGEILTAGLCACDPHSYWCELRNEAGETCVITKFVRNEE